MEFPIHPVTLGAFISISPPSLRRGARPRLFAPLGSERQGHGSVPAHRLATDRILRTITSVNRPSPGHHLSLATGEARR
jgi:hypothetical protein